MIYKYIIYLIYFIYQISPFGVATKVKQAKNPQSTRTYLVTPTTPVGVTEFPPALFHDKS